MGQQGAGQGVKDEATGVLSSSGSDSNHVLQNFTQGSMVGLSWRYYQVRTTSIDRRMAVCVWRRGGGRLLKNEEDGPDQH